MNSKSISSRPVVLVHPRVPDSLSLAASIAGGEHLGLEYLAAALEEEGYPTIIVNSETRRLSPTDALRITLAHDPIWIGLSPTSMSVEWTRAFTTEAKKNTNCYIVCGGNLATLMAEDFLRAIPVDAVVLGPGEMPAVALTKALAQGLHTLKAVPNLVFRNGKKICRNLCDFQGLFNRTLSITPKRIPEELTYSARILSSIGCVYRCIFCTTPPYYGNKRVVRSVREVVNEMSGLNTNYGVTRFFFNDDIFLTASEKDCLRTERLLREVASRLPGAQIRVLVRADAVVKWRRFLLSWRARGMSSVFMGVESASDRHLSNMHKGTINDMNLQAIAALSESGMYLTMGFIMFPEDISMPELRQNLDFLKNNGQLFRTTVVDRCVLGYPGTEVYRRWKETGRFDVERSSSFLLYPLFSEPSVRMLSIAMEKIEKLSAKADYKALTLHRGLFFGKVSAPDCYIAEDALKNAQSTYYECFRGSMELAQEGRDAESIVRYFMENSRNARDTICEVKT